MPTTSSIPIVSNRTLLLLYAGCCAAAATSMISTVTIAAIATERMLGDATWSGFPVALSVLGTAAGSQLIAWRLTHSGPRRALSGQYLLAAVGASVAAMSVPRGSLAMLCSGLFVVGLGNGATQYTRYLAADTAPPHRRGRVLSWVVWMGSFGAVVGPNLLAPAGRVARVLGLAEEAGPFLSSALGFAMVAVAYRLLHPTLGRTEVASDPADGARVSSSSDRQTLAASRASSASRDSLAYTQPAVPPAVAVSTMAMVIGHVVMVWIMTMTPIQLSHHGHGLEIVGLVISAHIAGMYLLAPLVGALVDRFGPSPVMRTAAVLLATACVLAALASTGGGGLSAAISVPMAFPLFLLGLGWNFGFVGGSARLSAALPPDRLVRGRARADTAIWIGAAIASSTSSLVFAQVGFTRLAWTGFILSAGLAALLFWPSSAR